MTASLAPLKEFAGTTQTLSEITLVLFSVTGFKDGGE